MRFLVILSLFGSCIAAPSGQYGGSLGGGYKGGIVNAIGGGGGYGGGAISLGGYGGSGKSHGLVSGASTSGYIQGGTIGGSIGVGGGGYGKGYNCGPGKVQNIDGTCFDADVSKNVYVYESPKKQIIYGPPPIIPKGRIFNNVIYVKTPEIVGTNDPIIIPPTQTKTTLYVLSKNGQQGKRVVKFAEGPQVAPEVFYVHYNDGENPTLPNGLDLKTALASAGTGLGSLGHGGGYGGAVGGGHGGAVGGDYGGASIGGGYGGASVASGYGGSVASGSYGGDNIIQGHGGGYSSAGKSY